MIDVKNASNNGMNCLNGSYPLTLSSIFSKMKVIKKKISVLGVKYDSQWRSIDINFGSVVFHLFKGQIMIDETPYYDEHLVLSLIHI